MMASWGQVDFSEFVALRDRLEQLQRVDLDAYCEQVTKEVTKILFERVVQRTPRKTGTLARGWTTGNIVKSGDSYSIEVINPIAAYAEYVEFGHTKRNRKGWVKGFFMLTVTERELQRNIDEIVREKIEALLLEVL